MSVIKNKFIEGSGTAGQVLISNGSGAPPSWGTSVPSLTSSVAIFNETQSSGTPGGTFPAGFLVTRIINTTQVSQSWASLSTNQITLDAGVYLIQASMPAYFVNGHKAVLYNITDSTIDLIGSSEYGQSVAGDAQTHSIIYGQITPSSSKTYEIQHQAATTSPSNGLGVAVSFGMDEVYTQIIITKLG